VEDFLACLKAKGSADLNAVMTTLNEGGLCRETLEHWKEKGWVEVAPAMPLVALRGERFSRDVTLREFCGEPPAEEPPTSETETPAAAQTEERGNDDHT
jgi:hypothetical protein